MKILLTGGGTGGHFYPIIAVAEELNRLSREEKILDMKLFFMSPNPYNPGLLYNNSITFKKVPAGKVRRYFSILNFFDLFKTGWGIIRAMWEVFNIFPDVVFSKGGYASFPPTLAAKLLGIPVIIHESDTVPGKVNAWAGKFAKKIALSYPEAGQFFPAEKTAYTGNPVRRDLMIPLKTGAKEFLHLEENIPVVLVLGGSLGAQIINENLIDALPKLVEKCQIIHQTGKNNFRLVKDTAGVVLQNNPHANRYKPFDYLDVLGLRMASGAADVVVSRAGSAIFEIAVWGVPSIIIPIASSNGNHQVKNAFAYERSGSAIVIEEENLTPNILIAEINRILENPAEKQKMKEATKNFVRLDAAEKIAKELVSIALRHESR